jgi:Arc/MetJ-type ribon-helix-helix transcriptional regulator
MQIVLEKPEYERFVRDQISGGQYPSAAAVIEAALSRMMCNDFAPGELNRLAEEGEASIAKFGLLKAEDVFRRLEEKSAAARRRAAR